MSIWRPKPARESMERFDQGFPTYQICDDARRDIVEFIELFHNPKRMHTNDGVLSPVDFEIRQHKRCKGGAREIRCAS